jgi:hypothetical protein
MLLDAYGAKSFVMLCPYLAKEVNFFHPQMGMGQNPIPLVNIKIAGKWMFIPLKMGLIGIDPSPNHDSFAGFCSTPIGLLAAGEPKTFLRRSSSDNGSGEKASSSPVEEELKSKAESTRMATDTLYYHILSINPNADFWNIHEYTISTR